MIEARATDLGMTQPREARWARRFTVWSLAITAACLPLYVVRWHYGPLPTTLLETLIGITVVGYLATLWTEKRLPAARTPYDIPIVLFLVAGVLGIVVAPDHIKAAGTYRAYFLEGAAIFYIAVDMLRTRDDLRPLLLAAAAGSSIVAIGQVVSFVYVAAHHHLLLGDAPAFLNLSPNADAMFLEVPLAFAAAFVLFPSRPRERLVAAVVLGLVVVAVILTLSRASYLAMAVLAALLVLSVQSRRWRIWMVGGLAVATLIVLEIPFINQRIASLSSSAALRSSIFGQALRMLSERPIFGAGIDGFPVRVAPFRPGNQTIELYPHDLLLTTWSEIGLLGLIALALIMFGVLWRASRAIPQSTDIYRPLLWGCVGTIILWLVHGLFDSPFWKNDLSVELWLVAALQVVAARAVRPAAGSHRGAGP
ncbi:MAG TPA: O-antigen ligase family protein [Candidatus Dormibacteraeota bacterium]